MRTWGRVFLFAIITAGTGACGFRTPLTIGDNSDGPSNPRTDGGASSMDGGGTSMDGSVTAHDLGRDARPTLCNSNRECDDGIFCNGFEQCTPQGECVSIMPPIAPNCFATECTTAEWLCDEAHPDGQCVQTEIPGCIPSDCDPDLLNTVCFMNDAPCAFGVWTCESTNGRGQLSCERIGLRPANDECTTSSGATGRCDGTSDQCRALGGRDAGVDLGVRDSGSSDGAIVTGREITPEMCTDGVDNDSTGTFDCDDPGCNPLGVECCDGTDDNDNSYVDEFTCGCSTTSDCTGVGGGGQVCWTALGVCAPRCDELPRGFCRSNFGRGSRCNATSGQCTTGGGMGGGPGGGP